MKRFMSVALATAMIASLGVTAFADNTYLADVKKVTFINTDTDNGTETEAADEAYFVLTVTAKNGNEYLIADDSADLDVDAELAKWSANELAAKEYSFTTLTAEDAYTTLNPTDLDDILDAVNAVTNKDKTVTIFKGTDDEEDVTVDEYKVKFEADNYYAIVGVAEADQAGYAISKADYIKFVKHVADAYAGNLDYAKDKAKTYAELDRLVGGIDGVMSYDDIEDIDDLKVSLKLTDGDEYVADYYIDEIDDEAAFFDGYYAIVLELNDNYTTKKQKIKGEVTLKNKTKKLKEHDFSINLRVEPMVFDGEGNDGDYKYEGEKTVSECTFDGEDAYINLVQFNDQFKVAKFEKEVENIELEDDNGFYFDVKASDQGKLNLAYDNVAIKSVARIAPVDADLSFFNFYGYPQFDFTGKVTLTPEEDDVEYFVYAVSKDGKISKVNAKLNEDGDAYEFKTRTLGCYVLSDMELPIDEINNEEKAPVVDEAPVVEDEAAVVAPETGKTNPGTGC